MKIVYSFTLFILAILVAYDYNSYDKNIKNEKI